jgi:hypothetical protein
MNLPKTFEEIRQAAANRPVLSETITWDGTGAKHTIDVPVLAGHCLIAVNNGANQDVVLTFEHQLYYKDLHAAAQIGTGNDGTVTVTVDEPGPGGEEYSITVALGQYTDEPIPLSAVLDPETKKITVTLAADESGGIDAENTAELVAAVIDDLDGISATASGEGTDPVAPTQSDVQFDNGYEEIMASIYGLDGNALSLTVGDEEAKAFEPLAYFPRFLGGRITLTAGTAPTKDKVTIVHIREV